MLKRQDRSGYHRAMLPRVLPLLLLSAAPTACTIVEKDPLDTGVSDTTPDTGTSGESVGSTGTVPTTSETGGSTASSTGDGSTGDPTTGALDCQDTPGTVHIFAPELGIDIVDPAPIIHLSDMQPNGFRGVVDGQQYWLLRLGDSADLGLSMLGVGIHDMADYPYHLGLLVGPAGVDCEKDPRCTFVIGLGGAWNIESQQPFAGTLTANTLTADDGCWEDGPPVDLSACRVLAGTVQACFNVAWP